MDQQESLLLSHGGAARPARALHTPTHTATLLAVEVNIPPVFTLSTHSASVKWPVLDLRNWRTGPCLCILQEPLVQLGSHTVMHADTAAYVNITPTGVNPDLKESLP